VPLIIPPGFLQAVYEFTTPSDAEPMVTTMGHVSNAATFDPNEQASVLFQAYELTMLLAMSSAYTLNAVDVYIGTDGPEHIVGRSTNTPAAGANTGTVVPQNTAYLIRKRTDAAGRRGRGRMYIPGVKETEVDNVGNLTAGQITQWNNVGELWLEALTEEIRDMPPVILHRSEGIGVEPAPTPVVTLICESKVATQRRRLRP
jgi:hypothetical protein